MRQHEMLAKTVAAPTEGALYEHATELQFVPPFPIPIIPYISDSEFSELANIQFCEKGRGRIWALGTILGFPHISNGELNAK